MNLACKSAILNRGVSHLIFPDEVPKRALENPSPAGSPAGRLPSRDIAPPEDALQAAIDLLRSSKRPVIVVGHGARFQMKPVVALAEQLKAPIITTFKGKGQIPDSHPLAGGVLGRSGTPIASWLMNEADCLLVLGASFSNHTGITPKKPTIQVDYDLMTLAKFHAIDVPLWGEIGVTAKALAAALTGHRTHDQSDDVAARWAIWREEKSRRARDDRGKGINAAILFEKLGQAMEPDAIIAVDVGNNTYSFGRYFECRNHAVLMSGYLGSIGFSFPAAMGAWAATQEDDTQFKGRQVVSVSGDGGLGQYLAEINTAVKYGMNITHVLMNNGELGKISKEQRAGNWEVWQTDLHNPNFADYAELCGAMGIRVTRAQELDDTLQKALSHKGPALVEVMTDAELV
jgi:thiamine pyrophosphate-dependent acetolactate synthase large subunit-like protein